MQIKHFDMYKDWESGNVILDVIGLDGKTIQKLKFDSYNAARVYILKQQKYKV